MKANELGMLNGYCLIELVEAKAMYGSLHIPDTGKDQPQLGIVIAVCAKWREAGEYVETLIRPQDKVLFARYAGSEVEIEGKKYLTIRERDLIAIAEPAPASSEQSE